jgi:UDP-glucose 4-epimerase
MTGQPLAVVTGGAGFIGSHTVDALVRAGRQVIVLDDFSTGRRENLAAWDRDERVEVITANIADGLFAPLHEATGRRGAVAEIVHLAAQTSVVHSIENPLDEVRSNCIGTVQVLDYARRTGVGKLVFASSAAVYGDVASVPVAEDARCQPLSPYGIDKRTGELWLAYHAAVHRMASVPLRFFNVYGPRQDPSSPYSGVISIFVERVLAGRELVVFGDGQQSRDFIYVADVVRAILAALESEKGGGQPINVATGRETTVNQLAAEVVRLAGSSAAIRRAPARPGEILRSLASVDRARQLLAFSAEVSLADGLARTIEWLRQGRRARSAARE